MAQSRVAVIGAGIAGLTAAIFLRRAGFDVTVYERTPALAPVGAAILLAPNALRALEGTGIVPRLLAAGMAAEEFLIADAALRPIQRVQQSWVRSAFGHGMVIIRRSDLHALLAEALGHDALALGKELAGLEPADTEVRLHFADGTQAAAAWVLGADGIHSRVRAHVCGEVPLRYGGQTCFRALVPYRLPPAYAGKGLELWGGAFRVGLAATRPDEVYYWCAAGAPPGRRFAPGTARPWLLEGLAAFPPFVRELVAATPEEALIHGDLLDFPPLRRWSRGRVGLLGDAAHATTPNMGQGGAQAIEDGYHLARVLDGRAGTIDLGAFHARRHAKTARITRDSYRIGRLAHLQRFGALRDALLRSVPQWLVNRQAAWVFRL